MALGSILVLSSWLQEHAAKLRTHTWSLSSTPPLWDDECAKTTVQTITFTPPKLILIFTLLANQRNGSSGRGQSNLQSLTRFASFLTSCLYNSDWWWCCIQSKEDMRESERQHIWWSYPLCLSARWSDLGLLIERSEFACKSCVYLLQCIKCHLVDMTLDASQINAAFVANL